MASSSKACSKCQVEKELDEFSIDARRKGMSSYYRSICRACENIDNNKYYYAHHDEKKKVHHEYFKKNPDKFLIKTAKARERHPQKYRARVLLRGAVRAGKIMKLPCVVCSDPKSQGHHEDYSKPLEVIWLCSRHHGERHRTKDLTNTST